jgi:uncharacterized protein YdaU (DUF1376 family)
MSAPYIPLYIDDFDGATAHLTCEEEGAYMRLIKLAWRTPGCSLPNDDAWIARKIRMTPEQFAAVAKPVLGEFFKLVRGRWVQGRLKKESDKLVARNRERSEAGKRGGVAKALKDKQNTSSVATVLPKQPEPEPEPVYTVGFSALWGAASDMMRKRSSKKKAEAAYRVVCTRTDPTTVLNALLGYLQNDEDVKRGMGQPALDRWLRDGRWEAWASTPATERTDDQWRAILSLHSQTGRWSDELGPRPGEPGCMVPPHFLIERVA